MESHLLQMRGLKLVLETTDGDTNPSHLLQMRGLKHLHAQERGCRSGVASFTDAWIETFINA